MTVDFNILKRNELRAAVRLVGRAFEDYEYFTNREMVNLWLWPRSMRQITKSRQTFSI